MDYGMISQIEKARLYADEPERVTFKALTVTFKGDNSTYTITLNESGWHCTCPGFQSHHICPHIMAMERVFKPMLKIPPLPYAPGQNVVSDVEKAVRYADERDRILVESFNVTLRGNNGDHAVSYDRGAWHCDSNSFRLRGVSSHTMAMERILKGMLAEPQKV
ncbi:MAG: SWIM zinc finger family protein [Anaerolineae bacterium]|nr:SWIM zinc finger family protein [Anaerolineae bacterium]